MFRFFLPSTGTEQEKSNNEVVITKNSDVHHICNVLRLSIGDEIEVVSNNIVNICKITEVTKQKIVTQIISQNPIDSDRQITPQINLFLALIKPSKFELACEKCTEIGINSITPILTQHSQFNLDVYSKKIQRFNKICEVASKQSKRTTIPIVKSPIAIKNYIPENNSMTIIFDNQTNQSIQQLKLDTNIVNYFIGPEGGWGKDDYELMKNFNNVEHLSLGKNILRAETAAIVGVTVILEHRTQSSELSFV